MEFQEFIKNRKSQPGFVYIWTNKINGKKYIGSHKGHPQDGYLGSGVAFNNAINKYGIENFRRNIVYRGSSYRKMETFFIRIHKAIQSDDYYNLSHIAPGYMDHSDESREKMKASGEAAHARTEVKVKRAATYADPEWKAKMSASATESNNRPEVKAKKSASATGNVIWNNGLINKRSKTCPGPEWVRGRLKKSFCA